MIKCYEIKYNQNVNFEGVIKNFGLDELEDTLVIEDTEKETNRFFCVIENGKVLSQNDLKLKFKEGDFVSVSDGVVQKVNRLIYGGE